MPEIKGDLSDLRLQLRSQLAAPDQHEQTAAAAERVRRTVESDDLLGQMLRAIRVVDSQQGLPYVAPTTPPPNWSSPLHDCGCSYNQACMNVACPRRVQVPC